MEKSKVAPFLLAYSVAELSRVSKALTSWPVSRKLQRLVSVSAQKVSCTSLDSNSTDL